MWSIHPSSVTHLWAGEGLIWVEVWIIHLGEQIEQRNQDEVTSNSQTLDNCCTKLVFKVVIHVCCVYPR